MNANAAASAAELHLKMCKKVAQLTKVIFHLNTRNEDYQAEAEHSRTTQAAEVQKLTRDAVEKMKVLQGKLQTQAATAAQRERQHVADRQKLMNEAQQQQRRTQASRAAAEEAFQAKVTDLEAQVESVQRAFDERIEELTQLAAQKEKERILSAQEETVALEARLEELKLKHTDEVEQLVTTSNAKYNKMLAEQLRAQDALKADLVSARHDWEKQKQEEAEEQEQKRLTQEMSAKAAFDQMKHGLVTKIEALLVETEALRGSETKLREEKENLVKSQQEAARTMKQLELQFSKAQQDSQSVRRDASAHSEELQRMLAVSTDKIDELAQELTTLKQTLQTRDRALVQAQKELEAAQLETLQQNATASELQARLKQQIHEHELQLSNRKAEALVVSQELQAAQKQIQKLEAELETAQKSIADMKSEGANDALARSKLKSELERAESDAKQAKADHERALETLQKTYDGELQQLKSSHTQEMATFRSTAATQLKQLELHWKETSAKSFDEKLTELKKEHERVLADREEASKVAQTKLRDELVKLQVQIQTLQQQLDTQTQQLTALQKQHATLTQQFESSQQQLTALQAAKDALHASTTKSQKERDEAHQKQLRELEAQREKAIRALTAEKNQLEQQHAQALLQLAQEHAAALKASTEEWEVQRLRELSNQDVVTRGLYEPQMATLREQVEWLQRALEASTEEAKETRRSLEETSLFEKEQLRSALVGFAERNAAERAGVEVAARQELEMLQHRHLQHEKETERRFMDDSRAKFAGLQAKADLDFARLAAEHRQELEMTALQHAEASEKLKITLGNAQERAIVAERAEASQQVADLKSKKDRERSEALLEAQKTHDQQYGELRTRMESTQQTLTKKTLDWASAMREGQHLSAALAAKTEEMALKVAQLKKTSREQVETLKLAAKREMDKLLEENLAETKQLSDQFEETRRLMAEKVAYLKTMITEWQDKYARRESRPEDIARIVELERLVMEKDALTRRTLDEMAYFKRELLNREEMYNKTFSRTPNVGMLQVLKPHVQMQQQMQQMNPMQATPPPRSRGKPKAFEQPVELQRRRSERSGLGASPPTSAASSYQKALPPLHNNQGS
ncbi:hypothetical protein V7S43_013380 [Phytophthora oleae]|uniref:Protein FAM184A/B N-terminal domain-containing protein n=1 Tax=Phytophthora oleae TaxID=2107226 RepID=A0ABD3F5H9_9STRA